jgi:hypothetical protein
MTELVIPARLNGPPTTANGGVSAGLLAAHLPSGATVEVTLRRPPRLDTPMRVDVDRAAAQLFDGADLVAEAQVVDDAVVGAAVPAVDVDAARLAATGFDGHTDHPFPTCFVCGTSRPARDGLEVFAGPVDGDRHLVAAPLAMKPIHRPPFVPAGDVLGWAALDCPSGWACGLPGRPAVLGRLTARISQVSRPGEICVVVGQLDRWEGRKAFSRSTLYGPDGTEYARAGSLWIEIARCRPGGEPSTNPSAWSVQERAPGCCGGGLGPCSGGG